ncbi:hypothetical protein GKQ23_13620 [Erwinia sp. E602]|uniref:phage tail assembly chaperone n=1 Tax=Erwinia sp. E602 TaxID=2675378 RepID=UPI001BAB30F5|nr:hypothetical protein [Erwinia sp. E602]QUG75970.1 hypothetical protein GKQ23_13620 [Erwinia sp. E602]
MEFEINGVEYRAAKLTVFDQLKVSRKLLPVLAGVVGDLQQLRDAAAGGEAVITNSVDSLLPKIAQVAADMTDEDVNAILHPCLAVVSRRHEKGWVPVFRSGQLMFDDIDLMALLQIAGRVVGDSLGNFLPAAPAKPAVSADPAA